MIYEGFELDENSKAKVCPRCKNEQTTFGDYCIICGSNLVNRCTGYDRDRDDYCRTLLPGNARYCFICGDESTFLQNQILDPWGKAESIKQIASTQADDDGDIPF
jgi:RNA polymerase subunit RPABC4/transcription elongation factor Spt4